MKYALLLMVVVTVLIKPLSPFMEYAINYDYISKVLCEKKDNPEEQCEGKCYLKKTVEKNSTDDNRSSSQKLHFTEINVLFCEKITIFKLEKNDEETSNHNFKKWMNMYSFDYMQNILHPPTVSV